ncbi:SusC/RagA family TonB-linked outer membrane protein [Parapedobacter koreensis]|uniref:TonB-linked outer membrane protein, SusC/RagA family n=1 Tax=Parapedobacter koreensis TaxID=332977 RepID=A0A1H7SNI5_9SPHI|nr:TonB-dependent receptor [Parapedobacter koreensis]SEL74211.1 TonB-linked outer membrane protein, SusC/RagA family [Parapedobacter koreensis]
MSIRSTTRRSYAFVITLLVCWASIAYPQTPITVTGKITSQDGTQASGVSVSVKGTSTAAASDAEGNYRINAPGNGILVFTQLGSVSQEIPIDNRTVIDVTLAEDVSTLDEVVVVGFGTQKKVNLSGAVAQVTGAEIANRPTPSLTGALQGVLPGVTVIRGSGQPGDEGLNVRIRGFTSANTAQALVLVDGIQMDMNLLNPDDIESISVLKDASAKAIYGARAAAGVILITTKRGKEGRTRINFNNYYGINITARQPQRLNSWDEQTLIDESRFNATGTPEFSEEQIEWLKNPNFSYRPNPAQDRWEYFDNNNWLKEGMDKVNTMQNYSLSVGGGTDRLNYLVSGSYYQRDGVLRYGPDDNSRYNLKANINAELNKYLSVEVVAGYIGSYINRNAFGTEQIINRLYRSRTRQSLYTPEEDMTGQPYNGDLQINPVDIQKNGGLETRDYETFTGRLNLKVKNVVKGLTLDLVGWRNQDYYSMENNRRSITWWGRTTNTTRFQVNVPNSMSMTKNRGYHNNLQGYLTYNLQLADSHNFTLMGGASFEEYRKDEFGASAQSMITNDFFSFNFADPLTKTNRDLVETWAMGSFFGRLNYNFREKYLFEASFRYDGSSRLAPENRWEIFPSFSAAWRIDQENFMQDQSVISALKLRGSWGRLGNGSVLGLYDYIPLLISGLTVTNQSNLVFNDLRTQYFFQNTLASPQKTWETVQEANVGIDAGFLRDRLTLTADYYVNRNKNMLAQLNVPNIIGVGVSSVNIGELKSWGWELDVKWRDNINNLGYRLGFNISDNQNELVKYDGRNSIGNGGAVSLLEGYPLNSVWGYRTDGYFQTQEEYDAYKSNVSTPFFPGNAGAGDVKYLDLNGDGVISAGEGTPENPGDLVYLGTTNARYTYGLDLGLNWKNFDLSVFFQGAAKRAFLIDEGTLSPMLGTADMPWTIHMDRWTPENPDALFPRMYQTSAHNFRPSDKWAQNGSYIRLKNVQLGYNIPINRSYVQQMRVFFSGQDLWEYTKVLSVFDPEVGNNVEATAYPFFRTLSFGLNVTF